MDFGYTILIAWSILFLIVVGVINVIDTAEERWQTLKRVGDPEGEKMTKRQEEFDKKREELLNNRRYK